MVNGDIYKQIEEHIRGRKFDQSNAIKIQEVKAQVTNYWGKHI